MTPDERYEDLVDEFAGVDGVEGLTPPMGGSGFGRGALRYRRKIFAMFVRGHLVVKLPAPGWTSSWRAVTATASTPTRARR